MNPDCMMARVLACVNRGMHDRVAIAQELCATEKQVYFAFRNLQGRGYIHATTTSKGMGRGNGRAPAIYAKSDRTQKVAKSWAGVNSVFGLGAA